ncbi:methuselah-like 10 isoform 3-T3 [Glossina fuscipes fuscipes]
MNVNQMKKNNIFQCLIRYIHIYIYIGNKKLLPMSSSSANLFCIVMLLPRPVKQYYFHLIVFVFVLLLPKSFASVKHGKYHAHDSRNVPCPFYQTVNITDDIRLANGSVIHDDVVIPPNWIGVYDYVFANLQTRVPVSPHLRGCICKVRPCINLCCPMGSQFWSNTSQCEAIDNDFLWPTTLNVTQADGTIQENLIAEQFAVVNFRPCLWMYVIRPELDVEDEWHLCENGSLVREFDQAILDIKNYCFVPTTINNRTDSTYILNPAICVDVASDFYGSKVINAYTMLFSVPFMVLTIVVYLWIPELRNQHGKSLVCYLLGLSVGYSLLSFNTLLMDPNIDIILCKLSAYTTYYAFVAAFFWLHVIGFDLWHNFRGSRGINRFQEKRRYLLYSLYAWGMALVFLILTFYAEEISDIPAYLKPGIGIEYCFLNMLSWSPMIYFFGPIIVIVFTNIIMFIMTAIKIHKVQKEMSKIMAREDSTKNLRNEKDRFCLFLRLFLVMGVTWTWEIMSYFVGSKVSWSKIFYVGDVCNAIQGFIIFMLFVMKKKVKELITNRIFHCNDQSTGASQTNSTNSLNSNAKQFNTNQAIISHEKVNDLRF